MVSMNRLSNEDRVRVIACLVEGNSIRSTVRMTGIAKNTIAKLLVEIGAACSKYQDETFRNLRLNRIQCDEIWSFVYAKQKNVTVEMLADKHAGDVWTWTAIDAETKLIPCWMIGGRDANAAHAFIGDLACRLANRVQLTTDGHKAYLTAVEGAFGADVDYAMLVKIYGDSPEGQKRYSPAECMGCKKETQIGNPDPKHISTSYVERANLTMRMGMRRFTRLTNAFSKKVENHAAALALHFMFYNFACKHQTLKMSPAMAAGITTKLWSIADIVALIDNSN
jgi:IS1 family transposase